jgi:Uma2 family endonuclease
MSAAPLLPSTAEPLRRKRFTRDEVDHLSATGFFQGQRFELVDGDLYDKMGQNPPHAFAISLLLEALAKSFPPGSIRVQLPIEVAGPDRDTSLPEPDVALLAERKPEYRKRHPRGDEVLLIVEVADSSAGLDLSRKATLYAAAGVPEYWVVDLVRRMVVVHRRPDGVLYRLVELLGVADSVGLEGRPESIPVSEILPEA